jgi:hypothetical protein
MRRTIFSKAAVYLLGFTSGSAISFLLLPIWIIPLVQAAREGPRSDWLGFAGAIIAATLTSVVAVAAIYFATKQIRINVLLREEDRIDKLLPGLRNAINFIEPFLDLKALTTMNGAVSGFQLLGFGANGSTLEKDIERALPATDDATRAEVLSGLHRAYGLARAAEGSRTFKETLEATRDADPPSAWAPGHYEKLNREIAQAASKFEAHRSQFANYMDELFALSLRCRQRIERYERRRIHIRTEIEEYFGD